MSEDQDAYDAGTGASHKLFRETQAAKVLRAQLSAILHGDPELAADMMEAETNINEAIDEVVQQLASDYAAQRGLDAMIEDFTQRRDRVERRIGYMRTALAAALEQAGRKKIEHPAVTLSLRATPPSVIVTDEAAVPAKFWVASEPKLSKKAVLTALKASEDVPGAILSNGGQTIAVKWG